MSDDPERSEGFSRFVAEVEPKLRHALTGALGADLGREAAAEALAYGWEHWDRIAPMDNPAGYLYRVGLNWGRRRRGRLRRIRLPEAPPERAPWIEPRLPAALAALSEQQRLAVYLVHGHEWTLAEVARLQGVAKGTVQNHLDRAMKKLQRTLGVEA